MTVTWDQAGTTTIISLHGRLDTQTAPILHQELQKGLAGIRKLYWDFKDLEYVTSAGIREMLIARSLLDEGADMKVINANAAIQNALYLTGMTDLIEK